MNNIRAETTVGSKLRQIIDILLPYDIYRDEYPWKNLRNIYESVLNDFKPADEISWTLIESR